jgi:hypothetical protein
MTENQRGFRECIEDPGTDNAQGMCCRLYALGPGGSGKFRMTLVHFCRVKRGLLHMEINRHFECFRPLRPDDLLRIGERQTRIPRARELLLSLPARSLPSPRRGSPLSRR